MLVASYLLSPGIFADQIRRDCLAAGADGVSPVLGARPEIADVVLSRYAETLADGSAPRPRADVSVRLRLTEPGYSYA